MSQIPSIACDLPGCQNPGEQTPLSIDLRITALVLGLIATTLGVLSVLNIPGLHQLGQWGGWGTVGGGLFLGFIAASIKCVQGKSKEKIDPKLSAQNPAAEQNSVKEEGPLIQTTLPNGKTLNYEKSPRPSQEILSEFPPIVIEHLQSAPHLIVEHGTYFRYLRSVICDPLTVISSYMTAAFYAKLQVNHEPGEQPPNLGNGSSSIAHPFFMDIGVKKIYAHDTYWGLATVEEDEEERAFIHKILGSMQFKSDINNIDIPEKIIQIEKHDQLPYEYLFSLAWVLHRLFKKGFLKINDDIGCGTHRAPDPKCGYYRISLAQNQIV